jgi:hypothetical protein
MRVRIKSLEASELSSTRDGDKKVVVIATARRGVRQGDGDDDRASERAIVVARGLAVDIGRSSSP